MKSHARRLFRAAYWELRVALSGEHPNPPERLNRRDYPAEYFQPFDRAAIYAATHKEVTHE